ncbi:hypothetical protein BCR32DRAFT_285628 [Anaeromyces robustus]|uniref:Retrotransposon Copia-like N-terminal domain-containing protein n=1 Tax=Anaeromyces robustus TaxID=1754192 RepID=A0A1Y1WIV3_9FUNG|nr:hypothetical protein BCR32DRAFT_285628 [Anaeromyces robustus]|eukprot:ORX73467.1 hypothetical protein BCR32DRAFT_285628 [Anaeromyces robustus]
MPRPRNQNHTINIEEDNSTKGITFNYSESFNRIVELSTDNYTEWRTNIMYLLCINNLDRYVTEEKVVKLRKRDIKENLNQYTQDKFDESLVYEKSTSEDDIKK